MIPCNFRHELVTEIHFLASFRHKIVFMVAGQSVNFMQ